MFVLGVGIFTVASLAVGLAPSAAMAGWCPGVAGRRRRDPRTLDPRAPHIILPRRAGTDTSGCLLWRRCRVGASLGLVLGGVLTTYISWRFAFFINVPIGIAMMLAAQHYLAESDRRPGRFDLAGAISSTVGMTALVYGIVNSATAGWGDPITVMALLAGILLLVFFVLNESRTEQPIMPLRLFASRERSGAYAARILFLGAMLGFWFFITQFLQGVDGFSPLEAGLGFFPMTVANFVVAVCVPQLTRRYGNGLLLAGGSCGDTDRHVLAEPALRRYRCI